MADPSVEPTVSASRVILGVLLGIILKSALDTCLPPLLAGGSLSQLWADWPPDARTCLLGGQFIVFLILLGRFYFGAFRFLEEQKPALPVVHGIGNFVGTFILFSTFYLVSLTLRTTDFYYGATLFLHAVDFIWFLITMAVFHTPGTPLNDPVSKFLLWDVITFLGFIPWLVGPFRQPRSDLIVESLLLAFLTAITIVDFIVLRDFYFYAERWRRRWQTQTPARSP